jgi:predicted ArsR family transcriptional regulator
MAALMAADRAEFRFIRDTVELTDSALSQQVTTLEQAGYVTVTRARSAAGPAPGWSATPAGRAAFSRHLAVLNELATSSAVPQGGGEVAEPQEAPGSVESARGRPDKRASAASPSPRASLLR